MFRERSLLEAPTRNRFPSFVPAVRAAEASAGAPFLDSDPVQRPEMEACSMNSNLGISRPSGRSVSGSCYAGSS